MLNYQEGNAKETTCWIQQVTESPEAELQLSTDGLKTSTRKAAVSAGITCRGSTQKSSPEVDDSKPKI